MKKSVSLLLALAMTVSLAACSESGSSGDDSTAQKEVVSSESTEKTEQAEKKEIDLAKPMSLKAIYDDTTGEILVKWSPVEHATGYEYCLGNNDYVKTTKTEAGIKISEEGKEYAIKVRALREEGKTITLSDDSKFTLNVPISLGNPANITWTLDGNTGVFTWDAAKNADEYEILLGDKIFSAKENKLSLKGLKVGYEYDLSVKAKRIINGKTYESNKATAKLSTPSANPEYYSLSTCIFLDYSNLKNVLDAKKWEYTEYEKNGMTVVDVKFEDEKNNGLIETLKRAFGTAAKSYLSEYFSFAGKKINDDFSDIMSTIETIANSDSVKGYFADVDSESHENAVVSALASGASAFFADANIHFQYFYADKNKGAAYVMGYRLYKNNETYEKDVWGDYTKGSDGIYHLEDNHYHRKFNLKCAKADVDGNECWVTLVYKV
ncbi:MAG: hypothetical protein K5927_08230 [Lachnospiraceae bacterium]|nr:hypothetical protein [Lachnospiraceae bacterium]